MKTIRFRIMREIQAQAGKRRRQKEGKIVVPFHEPAAVPPGFGVRQSSGAFSSGPRAQKRQRTAAVQDASAPAAASSWFMVPMHAPKRKEALHERPPLPALPRPKRERGCPKAGR